jgi:hypothetical protein
MNITASDTLLIDPLSNSAFCVKDPDGNHTDAIKKDETWHIVGELNIGTKSYLKNTLSNLKKLQMRIRNEKSS